MQSKNKIELIEIKPDEIELLDELIETNTETDKELDVLEQLGY